MSSDRKDVPLLPERSNQHPVVSYAKFVLDRIRAVDTLWNRFDAPDPALSSDLHNEVFQALVQDDDFYTRQNEFSYIDGNTGEPGTLYYQHDRPPWEDGAPSHETAVPITTTPDVIADGITWYTELYPQFQKALEPLGDTWGRNSNIGKLLYYFQKRLLSIYSGKTNDYPVDIVDPQVLAGYLLNSYDDHTFSIDPADVTINDQPATVDDLTLIREIGNKIASDDRAVRPPFDSALKAIMTKEFS